MKALWNFIQRYLYYLGFALLCIFSAAIARLESDKIDQAKNISEIQQQGVSVRDTMTLTEGIRAAIRGAVLYQNPGLLASAQSQLSEVIRTAETEGTRKEFFIALSRTLRSGDIGSANPKSINSFLKQLEGEISSYQEKLGLDVIEINSRLAEAEQKYAKLKNESGFLSIFLLVAFSVFLWILAFESKENLKLAMLLNSSERLHRLMFAHLDEGIILCTSEGKISTHNAKAVKILGLNRRSLQGELFINILPRQINEAGELILAKHSPLLQLFDTRKSVKGLTLGLAAQEGKARWISLNSQPLMDDHNIETTSVLLSISDLTEKVESEKMIASQKVEIEAKSKMSALGEMATGIAHEINNPLALIMSEAEGLEQSADQHGRLETAEIKPFTERIAQTVERMAKIIKGMRTYARDGHEDDFMEESIEAMIDDAMTLVQHKIKNKMITLKVEVNPKDLMIECRATQVVQVIVNLLANAVDAIEEGSEGAWIHVQAVAIDGTFAEISITNSGRKISDEVVKSLFQPFFTTKKVGKGTGLGLSVSRAITKAHGGSLSLDTAYHSTRFVAKIPLLQQKELARAA